MNSRPILLRAIAAVAVGLIVLSGCAPQLKSDTGKEANDLVETYIRLQQAIKDQNLKVAYSLMSKSYQLTHKFNAFEAGHRAFPNLYPVFAEDSIVKVNGSTGEIMITINVQKEYWQVYAFVKEGSEWRCTGNERILTRGWD
jgi:hypothetical protein